jgi:ABC-type polysaccharide/polyol phosphate transport system ATPase subunit
MSLPSAKISDAASAIRAQDVNKVFSRGRSYDTAFRTLTKRLFGGFGKSETFSALKNLNFEIFKGEKIAIVGNNGSGKTTLLRVIAGLYRPSGGAIQVDGDMILLRGVAVGMIDELSAAENLFLYGSIYGLERETIKAKFHEIFKWAELEPFAGAKLGTFSTGMKARLAFSAVRYFEADIFLLDEAFSATDRNFKAKYEEVFRKQRNSDRTFVIATHDLEFARTFCTKTLWLDDGEQMAFDSTDKVLKLYTEGKATSRRE